MEVPLWEDLPAYIRNSAVFGVQNMKTPLMIEVGDSANLGQERYQNHPHIRRQAGQCRCQRLPLRPVVAVRRIADRERREERRRLDA